MRNLYDCFKNWEEKGTVYLIGDTHFSDIEAYKLTSPQAFKNDIPEEIIVRALDWAKVKAINSICGKKDTLVILGDVGNVDYIKELHAGRKVLVMGNHDKGASNYKRVIKRKFYMPDSVTNPVNSKEELCKKLAEENPGWNVKLKVWRAVDENDKPIQIPDPEICWDVTIDNKLFDEVYEGPLQINNKILLSHEPIDIPYGFNIHGHDHRFAYMNRILEFYDMDMNRKEFFNAYVDMLRSDSINKINLCCELWGNIPLNLNDIIKSGVLKIKPDIHRIAIDEAVNKKK